MKLRGGLKTTARSQEPAPFTGKKPVNFEITNHTRVRYSQLGRGISIKTQFPPKAVFIRGWSRSGSNVPGYLYKNTTRTAMDHVGFFKVALLEAHSPGIFRLSLSHPLRAQKPSHAVAIWLSLQGFGWIPQVFEAPPNVWGPLLAISQESNRCSVPGRTAMHHWPARHQAASPQGSSWH